jgi:S1-C subfamily serine protease
MNGTRSSARNKRKAQGSPEQSRDAKRLVNGKLSPGDNTPDAEDEYEVVSDDASDLADDMHSVLYAGTPSSMGEWQDTIKKVVSNVVAIRFCQTCSFDTDPALTSEATGFVVDSERGYILTNRHVVGSGPFWGHCVFDNHEEVDCYPVYRDPVHDFGLLKYDPKALKYMKADGLTLDPGQAKGMPSTAPLPISSSFVFFILT